MPFDLTGRGEKLAEMQGARIFPASDAFSVPAGHILCIDGRIMARP